jgi:hypothetical protein
LFDLAPAEQFRVLEARKVDLGFVGLSPGAAAKEFQWESIARPKAVVVLPLKHSLAKKTRISLADLKPLFFVGMSEETPPGFRQCFTKSANRRALPLPLADQKLSRSCQMYMLPKVSMSSHILRMSSGLPVMAGSSLTRSSQGRQTPGRTCGCGRPFMPVSFCRSAPDPGNSHGGVATGGWYVPAL